MADRKTITELTTLATVSKTADWLPVVDVSDTTESTYGTTKKAVVSQFLGDTGVQGDTGVAGDTGIGTKGDTGEQGDTGAASTIAGDTGVQGDTGVGTQGDTGEKGDTGADSTVAGDTGVQGDTGVGEKGDTGDQGDTGVGTQGDTGVGTQGDTGITGDTGVGIQGDTGEQGDTGIGQKGDTGEKGDTGVGEKGDTGEQGDTGADSTVAGPQGDTGVDGDTGVGEKGDTGEVGLSGDTGIQGDTGVGEKGDTGDQGDTGIEGDDGDIYATTSSTSINLDTVTGENTVTVGSGLAYSAAQSIIIANSDTNYIEATVVSYSGTTLTYTVGTVFGSGTYTSWNVNLGGAPGPQGDQGDTGVGVQGDTGVAGEDGDTGIQGDTGIGEKGDTGEDGGDGAVGATGADGEQGDTGVGIQGDTGEQGLVGATGAEGDQGDTGIGEQGDTGAVGATGVGEQGDTGVSGSDGDTGIQGDTGVGVQGDTGSQGLQGDTGQDGDTGVGEQGDTGQTGDTGTGTKGDTGVQGETGVTYPWEGAWVTATPYTVNDTVENDGSGYICTADHTSGATTEPGVGADWATKWDLFVEGIGGNTVPSGTVSMFAGSSAPTGYLMCDGSAVSRTTYANLFTAISTTWGVGNGSTTFNIPDMRGIFPKGAGTTGRAAGKDANGNYYAGTLGAYLTDKLQGHWHNVGFNPSASPDWYGAVTTGEEVFGGTGNASSTARRLVAKTAIADGTNGTPRLGLTTEPQSAGINYIIKT